MPVDAVSEVKSRLDIVEVIGGYVRLHKAGREHKALCPFHSEKTPSFAVSQERQAWYCFGCQEGGDLISFVEKIEHVDFLQALEMLAERAGVELTAPGRVSDRRDANRRRTRALELHRRAQAFYEHILWETDAGAPGRQVLADRQVSEETARLFGLGFAPAGGAGRDALLRYLVSRAQATPAEAADAGLAHPPDRGGATRDRFSHRLMFPIRDDRGAVIGFGARALGEAIPKYLNTARTSVYDKSTALFGIDLARQEIIAGGRAVVVEGYFDVIAAHVAGVRNTVASSGTALTSEQVRMLGRLARTVVLCFDSDDAGRAAASRAVDALAAEGVEARICVLPAGCKDPDELVHRDAAAFVAAIADAPPEWQVLLDRALDGAEGGSVEARRAGAERAIGLLTRVPAAATRDLYAQQAARRLELDAAAVRSDVERVLHRQPKDRGQRVVAALPAAPAADAAGLTDSAPGHPLASWEKDLASLVLQRPALAALAVERHELRLEELDHPHLRRIVEVGLELPPGEAFPLHLLGPSEQSMAAPLLMRSLPELQEDAEPGKAIRVVGDCVGSLRIAARRSQAVALERQIRAARDAGNLEEKDRLAVQVSALAAEIQELQRRFEVASIP
jgi:DNA primase